LGNSAGGGGIEIGSGSAMREATIGVDWNQHFLISETGLDGDGTARECAEAGSVLISLL
jgi:hypothetical protein